MVDQPDFEKARAEAEESNLFEEGFTELGGMAASAHELFTTFVKSGFESSQALYLTAATITNGPGKPPS